MTEFAMTFRNLFAWQRGYELTLIIYKYTKNFPPEELFGLVSQIRRASVSIISNIAEGFKKISKKERIHFYEIAECSPEEVKCHSLPAKDLGYLTDHQYQKIEELQNRTGRLLNSWIVKQK